MGAEILECDNCGMPIANKDNPPQLGDNTLCKDCHDSVCGNCLREIPDPGDRYNISAVGPGTTCPQCTARYVDELCSGCGTEIRDPADQVPINEGSKFDGVYCEDCAPKARKEAENASRTQNPGDSEDQDPPF